MNSKNISEREQQIIDDFALFDNWPDKYQYIIELGQELEDLPSEYRKNKYRIKGCQSNVWLIAELKNALVEYKVDSDSSFVKGLASLLLGIFNQQAPADIIKYEPEFLDAIGLSQHLAPNRAGGLAAMLKQVKLYALALQTNPNLNQSIDQK